MPRTYVHRPPASVRTLACPDCGMSVRSRLPDDPALWPEHRCPTTRTVRPLGEHVLLAPLEVTR